LNHKNGLFGGIRAIVFDFDGVILESGNIKTEAFLELFGDYPEFQAAILQYHLDNLGVSRFDKFEWIYRELLRRPLVAAEREWLGCRFSEIVLDKILSCPIVPGALDALKLFQGFYPLFVASGTPQEELDMIVRRRNLVGYFDGVWGTPRKKAEIIGSVLNHYEWRPEQVLMVGDGTSDYQAAVATGVAFVARDTPEQAERWRELQVERVADLRELPALLGAPAAMNLAKVRNLRQVVTPYEGR
jgi:phosphoglycolate phosphatase-like HAD superfamily hydrolase